MKNFFLNGICGVAMVLAAISRAQAQTIDYGALESLFGEPITTSATGKPQRASDVPVEMEIITADEIRRSGAHDIPQVLQNVAGMSVWQWAQSDNDVSVRGYNQALSPRLLVLINGRQVYLDDYGYTAWATLPVELEEIRQIEVVKGPNSALFGFNAAGGVINIVTYNPLYDKTSDAGVAVGSNEYAHAHAIQTVRMGDKLGIRLSAGDTVANQFDSRPGQPLNDEHRREINLDSVAQLTPNSQARIELTDSNARNPEYVFVYFPAKVDYDLHSAKFTYAAATGLGQAQFTAYRNWMKTGSDNVGTAKNIVSVVQANDLFQVGARHSFRVGAEYRTNAVFGNLETPANSDLRYDVASANGMWEWALTEKIKLTNAAREDHLRLSRTGFLPPNPLFASNADFDRSVTAFSYNSGIVWQATATDSLRLTAARGVQAPSLVEFGAIIPAGPLFYAGNPRISPTIVTNYEAGWDRRISIIGGSFSSSLFSQRTDEINAENVTTVFPYQQADDIGTSHAIGLETGLKGKFRQDWTWDANYLLEHVWDKLSVNGGGVITVPYDSQDASPLHTLNAHLGYANGPWEADIFGHYISDYKVLSNPFTGVYNLVDIPHYVTVNGRVGYKVNDNVTVALSGQELNHASAMQTTGAKPERQMFLSLSAHY